MATLPAPLKDETGYLLRIAYARASDALANAFGSAAAAREFEVLDTLAESGPQSQQSLVRLLLINRTSMVSVIDALEAQGLARRVRLPGDRRSHSVQLTQAGRERVPELSAAADDAESLITAPLTLRQRSRMLALLHTVGGSAKPRRVVHAVGLAHLAVRVRSSELLGHVGLTPARYGVLTTLDTIGPTSQQAIADRLGLSGPTVLETVDRLERDGLIGRRRDTADRRANFLAATDAGATTLRKARAAIASVSADIDRALGPEAHAELRSLLTTVALEV